MPAQIDAGDLPKIARSFAESGKPAPAWVTADPDLDAEYRKAAGLPPVTPDRPPVTGSTTRTPARKASRAPGRSTPQRPAGPRSPKTAPKPKPAPAPAPRAGGKPASSSSRSSAPMFGRPSRGDGGGLMLAFFAYPIVLAILQHGPSGAVLWLKAKFLNDEASSATSTNPYGAYATGGDWGPGAPPPNPNAPPAAGGTWGSGTGSSAPATGGKTAQA